MPSILSITNIYDKEPKRQNRWTLKLINVPVLNDTDPFGSDPNTNNTSVDNGTINRELQLVLEKCNRPKLNLEEIEQLRLNEKAYYPKGMATWDKLNVSWYDFIGVNTGKYIFNWMRAVYDPKTGAVGYKKFFAAEGRLYMLNPKGTVIEEWRLFNCWPTMVDFGQLDYKTQDSAMVTAEIRFDKAIPRFYDDPLAGFSPGTDTEGFASDPYGIPNGQDFLQGLNGVTTNYTP
jgi:hypothetical protein